MIEDTKSFPVVKMFSKKGGYYRPWNAEERFRVSNTSNTRDGYRYSYSGLGLKWIQLDQDIVNKIIKKAKEYLCLKYSVLVGVSVEIEEENDSHMVAIVVKTEHENPNLVEYKTWKFPLIEISF